MSAVRLGDTATRYARMTDVEVVRELWDTIGRIHDDDELSDTLYWLTGEMLERWAPEVEWAATELDYAYDKNRENEMASHAEFLARRRKVREIFGPANVKAAAVWEKKGSDA